MPDRACDVCRVPKPEIAFDHAEAHQGQRRNTCQACLREIRRPTRRRSYPRKLQRERAERLARSAAGLPPRNADKLADFWSRS